MQGSSGHQIHCGQEVRVSRTEADVGSLVSWLIFGIIFNLKTVKNECAFPIRLVFSGSNKY